MLLQCTITLHTKKAYIRVTTACELNMPTAHSTAAGILTYKPDDDSLYV